MFCLLYPFQYVIASDPELAYPRLGVEGERGNLDIFGGTPIYLCLSFGKNFGGGTQVSNVARNGIPQTRTLAGFHPAPRSPSLL